MTDDFYRVYGGEQREGAIVVSQLDEAVDYSRVLSGRVANIVPVDDIDQVTGGQRVHPDHRHLPGIVETPTARPLPLFGAQRLTSLGYACSVDIAMPQDAIEPIRRMCKWIVDEECDPEGSFRCGAWAQHRQDPLLQPGPSRHAPCKQSHRRGECRIESGIRAFDLFLSQGVSATSIEEICDRADIGAALLQSLPHPAGDDSGTRRERLVNLHDEVFARSQWAHPEPLVSVFDDIATTLAKSGDTYREIIGEMMMAAAYGAHRGSPLPRRSSNSSRKGSPVARSTPATTPRTLPTSSSGPCTGASSTGGRQHVLVNDQPARSRLGIGGPAERGEEARKVVMADVPTHSSVPPKLGFATTSEQVVAGVDLCGKTAVVTGRRVALDCRPRRHWPPPEP